VGLVAAEAGALVVAQVEVEPAKHALGA